MTQTESTSSAPQPASGIVDAFLSYSRADRDIAQRLALALEDRGRTLWVDWEGIAPTAEWMQEIREAIRRADAFVVVLSPDSASSRVCGIEIEQALAEGKRLISVVVRDVQPDDVLPELAKRQWLRHDEDVEATADQIVAVLDTDLDAVKQHTRLTVKAAEWDDHDGDRARLLRGSELTEAERWLAAPGRSVSATPTVTRFLVASRQGANRRQRLLVGAVSSALVVALVLGGFALAQRRTAVEQGALATTQALASASLAHLDSDPQTSLLLALEADRSGRSAVVDEALRRSVLASDVERVITPCDPGEKMGDVAFSPDGTSVYTTCPSRGLERFDLATGTRTLGGTGTDAVATGGFSSVAVAATGVPVMVGGFGTGVQLVDPGTGSVTDVKGSTPMIYQLTPTSDGKLVAEAAQDGIGRLLDARNGAVVTQFPAVGGELYSASPSPDGKKVAFSGADGVVRVYDVATTKLVRAITVGSATGLVAWSPNGTLLLTTSQDRIARIWDATTGTVIQQLGHNALINDAAWAGSDGFVVTGDSDGRITVWSVASGDIVSELLGHAEWVSFLAASPDGRQLASASEDGTVRIWRWGPGVPEITSRTTATVTGVSVSPDGARVVAAAPTDGTVLLDTATGRRIRTLDASAIAAPTFSQDGSSVVTSQWGAAHAALRLVDAVTGEVRWSTEFASFTEPDFASATGAQVTRTASTFATAFSPDGTRIAAVTELGVTVLDAATGHVLTTYVGEPANNSLSSYMQFAPVRGVAFTRDGSGVVAPDGNDVVLIDASTGKELRRFTGHSARVVAVAATTDGLSLVSTSEDTTARIWDLATGATTHVLQHQARVAAVAVDRDGLIATTSRDGNVQVWSPDGTLLQRTRVATIEATAVAFTPDGSHLVVGTGEGIDERVGLGSAGGLRSYGGVQVVDCPVCLGHDGLVALARSHAIRPITPAEVDNAVNGTAIPVDLPPRTTTASASAAPPRDLVGTWTASIPASALPTGLGYLPPAEQSNLTGQTLLRVLPSGRSLVFSFSGQLGHGIISAAGGMLSITDDLCGSPATTGNYRWTRTGNRLTLTAASDTCDPRRLLLTRATFTVTS